MNNYLADLFLEYWNDYLSVDTFAEHKQLKRVDAQMLINMGRKYHNERAKRLKEVKQCI
nr:hypothetical protein [uncultured Mediterranean phage uvMED]